MQKHTVFPEVVQYQGPKLTSRTHTWYPALPHKRWNLNGDWRLVLKLVANASP